LTEERRIEFASETIILLLILAVLALQVFLSGRLLLRMNQVHESIAQLRQELPGRSIGGEEVVLQDISVDDDPVRGPADAPVTIVEFSDFECPSCAEAQEMLRQITMEYGDQVRLVYRDFPLERAHPNALRAALAAECADEQGKFWKMHDQMFSHQDALASADLRRYANEIGLDEIAFLNCMESERYLTEVRKDRADGEAYGVQGTPTFFVNGRMITGARPYEYFRRTVEAALNAVK
jgi:protein-disulfide isomerase